MEATAITYRRHLNGKRGAVMAFSPPRLTSTLGLLQVIFMKELINEYGDSYLTGIQTQVDERKIELYFTLQENRKASIHLLRVKRCRFDDFTIGNIIRCIYTLSGPSYEDVITKNKFFKDELDSYYKDYYQKLIRDICDEKLIFIQIASSYGCEGTIICEDFEELSENDVS